MQETGDPVETHTMFLAGRFLSGEKILARTQFNFDQSDRMTVLKVAVRAENAEVSQLVLSSI